MGVNLGLQEWGDLRISRYENILLNNGLNCFSQMTVSVWWVIIKHILSTDKPRVVLWGFINFRQNADGFRNSDSVSETNSSVSCSINYTNDL